MVKKKRRGKEALKILFLLIIIPILLTIFLNWKMGLAFFGLYSIIKISQIKKRKYFAKDLKGNKVGLKNFMKRWKAGIEGITPLQQAKTSIMGTWITLSGIIAGVVINALVRVEHQWIWIEAILIGSLTLVVIQMIGSLQKYWRFKEVDKVQKELEESLKKKPKVKKEKVKVIKMKQC